MLRKHNRKNKNTFKNIKVFAKEKPIIFGSICLGILVLLIIIIAVPASKSKKKKSQSQDQGVCSNIYSDGCLYEKMIDKQK